MAEPTPGAPSGQSGGQRAATAATFQTNDASLRQLHATFQLLIDDVGKFNRALISLDKGSQSIDNIRQKLSGLGGAVGGGAAAAGGGGASSSPLGGETNFTQAGSGHAPNGGDSSFSGGSGAAQAGGRRWYQTPVAKGIGVGLGGAAAVGGWFNNRMGDISDLNLAYTQAAQGNGMGYSRGNVGAARQQLMGGVGGYQSVGDLLGGVGTITGSIGSTVGTGRSNQITTAVGGLAAAMPGMGYAGAAQAAGQLYTPAVAQRLRSMGVSPTGSHGRLQSPQQIYANIIRLVFRGQPITPNMIAEGMQPGAPLYVTLQAFGLDEAGIEGFRSYALGQAQIGQTRATRAGLDAAQGHATADTRALGLTTSIRSQQNRLGMAEARRTGEAERQSGDALRDSFAGLAHVVNATTDLFRGLNSATHGLSGGALGGAGVFGGPLANVVQHAGGIGGIGFTLSTIGSAWKTFRGGGGARGAARAGARSAVGMSGLQGTPVFVTNWPDGLGGGGSGGGGGGGNPLGQAEDEAEQAAKKGGRFGRFLRSPLTRRLGIGAAEGAAAGLAYSKMGVGNTESGILGGIVGGVGAVNPLAGAIVGGATVVGGAAIHHAITSGWIPGAPSNASINRMNAYANNNTLTNALHQAAQYQHIPGFRQDWDRIKPQVRALMSKRTVAADNQAAAMVNALMDRYKTQLISSRTSNGMTAGGRVFHSMFDPSQPMGDGPAGSTNGGRGPATWQTIENLANGAPPHLVTSTVRSGAAGITVSGNLSYHATGNAVDFAPPGGGQNNNKLLAINQFFARKYGKGLKELIYSGPGGTNLKDGKPYIYPKNVQDIHHNHVHVAATADSLKSVGGVTVGGAGSSESSGSAASSNAATGVSVGGRSSAASAMPAGIGADEASAFANILNQGFGNAPQAAVATSGTGHSPSAGGAVTPAGSGGGSAPSTPVTGTLGRWIKTALGLLHLDSDKYAGAIATIARHESGGNPRAVNNWDSNAKAGHPSKGLMQTIDSTFNAYALPGHHDIWNPVDNIAAATRYAISRYGSLDNVPGIKSLNAGGPYKGYFQGAWNTPEGPAYLHSDEMILPARTARKVRSMIQRTGSQPQSPQITIPTQGGAHRTTVTITAPITVVGKATVQDARDFLAMVKDEAEKNHTLDAIGSH